MSARHVDLPRPLRRLSVCVRVPMVLLGVSAMVLGCSTGTNHQGDNASPQSSDTRAADAKAEEDWAYSVGIQNYVFGLPLTISERERALRLDPVALEKAKAYAPAAPLNQIGHMKTLATA
ncbi:hypothetical protein ACWELJ_30810, partial [Nocardia sp. NPDC004582]